MAFEAKRSNPFVAANFAAADGEADADADGANAAADVENGAAGGQDNANPHADMPPLEPGDDGDERKVQAHELFAQANTLYQRVYRLRGRAQEESLLEIVRIYGEAVDLFARAQDTEGNIQASAEMASAKMWLAKIKTNQERFDEVFRQYFRSAIDDARRAQYLADQEFARALQNEQADAVIAGHQKLAQDVHMTLQHVQELQARLNHLRVTLENRIAELIDGRDRAKAAIGEERWKTLRTRSSFTEQRLELQRKLRALEALQRQIAECDGELAALQQWANPRGY